MNASPNIPGCGARRAYTSIPCHYLALLERKPGGLDHARPLEEWKLPPCFRDLRSRLEADLDGDGTREYIKVPRLLERHSLKPKCGNGNPVLMRQVVYRQQDEGI